MTLEQIEAMIRHHIGTLEKTLEIGGPGSPWNIGFDVAIENELRWLKGLLFKIEQGDVYGREEERTISSV